MELQRENVVGDDVAVTRQQCSQLGDHQANSLDAGSCQEQRRGGRVEPENGSV